VGRAPTAIAAGAGAVWVTSERDGTLTRIDPSTSDVETIDVGGAATDVAVGRDAVWVTVDVR
jgi:streptogramin lyase